jgi:hypothetical protein
MELKIINNRRLESFCSHDERSSPAALAPVAHEDERQSSVYERGFHPPVIRVAVVGPRTDSERRQKLIDITKQFETAFDFEFLKIDEGPNPPDCPGEVLRVCFRGDADPEADVDIETGDGIALLLAAIASRAIPEASKVERIVVDTKVCHLGGIWSPLFPKLHEIEFRTNCVNVFPHTFAGVHEGDSSWSSKRSGGAR